MKQKFNLLQYTAGIEMLGEEIANLAFDAAGEDADGDNIRDECDEVFRKIMDAAEDYLDEIQTSTLTK